MYKPHANKAIIHLKTLGMIRLVFKKVDFWSSDLELSVIQGIFATIRIELLIFIEGVMSNCTVDRS